MNSDEQACIFIKNQSKPLQKVYRKVLTQVNSKDMDSSIEKYLNDKSSAKEFNAAAVFMTEFTNLVSISTAKAIYQKLQNNSKAVDALALVQNNEYVMTMINASDHGEIELSMETKILREAMEALNLSERSIKTRFKELYGFEVENLPQLLYKNGTEADRILLAFLLVAHGNPEISYWNETCDASAYREPGIRSEVLPVLELVDSDCFAEVLKGLADQYLVKYQNKKPKYLAYPICRYADEELMKDLTARAPKWATSVSGAGAPPLYQLRQAVLYSDTYSAMNFAEKYHGLDKYAETRNMTEDEIRDEYLSDVGIDENGRKEYDLGTQRVSVVLQKNMTFMIETANGKSMKAVPKKKADPELYKVADEEFKQLLSRSKKIIKNRADRLFDDFLSGRTREAVSWKNAYFRNPLLRFAASHIVWAQEKHTFTLCGADSIKVDGTHYEIADEIPIKVAHPIEMHDTEIQEWQNYFRSNQISQPFEQIWEPAFRESEIKEDRYKGCTIFWRRVQNADKHGIHFNSEDFNSYNSFELEDCEIEQKLIGQMRHDVAADAVFELGKFKIKTFSRKVNHIIYLFDKWTIWDRIRKDDIQVMNMIERYTVSQIKEFINIAIESQAVQLSSALMSYKSDHFGEEDVFEEFVLEW